jgi:hypothetical protein
MSSHLLPCKLCGEQKKLIKAHIIPKQYYKRIIPKGAKPHLLKFEVDDIANESITQSGIYQDDLLCADCDNQIGQYDKYAYEVLARQIDEKKLQTYAKGLHVYEIGEIRVELFRLFLVSLAWRSGIARDPMFKLVRLGVYEEKLKQILQGKKSELLDSITAVIILFRPPKYPDIMWSPFCSKMDGINLATFYLPPWKIWLKLDQRPFGHPFDKFALVAGKPAYAAVQGFWSKGEFNLLCDFHQQSRKAAGLE